MGQLRRRRSQAVAPHAIAEPVHRRPDAIFPTALDAQHAALQVHARPPHARDRADRRLDILGAADPAQVLDRQLAHARAAQARAKPQAPSSQRKWCSAP
jgi:hypothetical protein